MDLLSPEVQARLDRARAGHDEALALTIGSLEPGQVGVLRATVISVTPPRSFNRKNGSQGTVGRVTLSDGTGEVDAVLWDDENRLAADLLAPGKVVTIRGAVAKAGYRGGIELSVGQAEIDVDPAGDALTVDGKISQIGETRVEGTRFQADITLETTEGSVSLVLWDDNVKAARALGVGASIRVSGVMAHPVLDGWYLADGTELVAQPS